LTKEDPPFSRIEYDSLNARQKENYNFQKLSARLADYGLNCLRLSDDWQGADLIACHIDGGRFLKVQLKGRLAVYRKYVGKDLFMAFFDKEECFVYPHDIFLETLISQGSMVATSPTWRNKGLRSWPKMPSWARDFLVPYKV